VAHSPDGTRIASGSMDHTIKVWDANTGLNLLTIPHSSYVESAAYSPDGSRIVTCSSGKVKVWDSKTGRELFTCQADKLRTQLAAFSADGSLILGGDREDAVTAWDATTGALLPAVPSVAQPHRTILSVHGDRIAHADGNRIRIERKLPSGAN